MRRFRRRRSPRPPTFSPENAAALKASQDPLDQQLAEIVARALADEAQQLRTLGDSYQVVLLDEGFELPHPIMHHGAAAWLRGQRYSSSDALKHAPTDTEELQALGG